MRQPGLLVEMDDGRLGIRSQLAGGRPQGVGRLQGVSSLEAPPAGTTMAHVNVETPKDGPARYFHLILMGQVIVVRLPAAIRAARGQGNVQDLVGFATWNLAVGRPSVVLAGFTPRRGGRVFGRPFGERGGLTLGGPQDFLELRRQLPDLGLELIDLGMVSSDLAFEFGNPSVQALVLGLKLFVGA